MSMLHTTAVHPDKSPLKVQYISSGGIVDADGQIQVNDEILSVNGKSLLGMGFEEALKLLQHPTTEKPIDLHLVIQRTAFKQASPQNLIVDNTTDLVELTRDAKNSLGLSIVGGVDHCSHPFGVERPGVFISKIGRDSQAAQIKKLRVGDRILTVNGVDLSKAKHSEAVAALKNSGKVLKLGVLHDVQPKGLKVKKIYFC